MRVDGSEKENNNLSEKLHKMSLEVKKLKSDLKAGNDSLISAEQSIENHRIHHRSKQQKLKDEHRRTIEKMRKKHDQQKKDNMTGKAVTSASRKFQEVENELDGYVEKVNKFTLSMQKFIEENGPSIFFGQLNEQVNILNQSCLDVASHYRNGIDKMINSINLLHARRTYDMDMLAEHKKAQDALESEVNALRSTEIKTAFTCAKLKANLKSMESALHDKESEIQDLKQVRQNQETLRIAAEEIQKKQMNRSAYMMKERNSMERVLSTIEKEKERLQTRLLTFPTALMNCKKAKCKFIGREHNFKIRIGITKSVDSENKEAHDASKDEFEKYIESKKIEKGEIYKRLTKTEQNLNLKIQENKYLIKSLNGAKRALENSKADNKYSIESQVEEVLRLNTANNQMDRTIKALRNEIEVIKEERNLQRSLDRKANVETKKKLSSANNKITMIEQMLDNAKKKLPSAEKGNRKSKEEII